MALKDNYDNWRFIKSKCKGIEEINTVHFIHLILSLFRKIKITKKHIVNISKKNNDRTLPLKSFPTPTLAGLTYTWIERISRI